ncbi:MAG: hypothetical protein NZZ41_07110 [Candidatus Dojkabacteria bacterium]|nr:hypothetical protein [Candidatus Dojkabacteria bacterium]
MQNKSASSTNRLKNIFRRASCYIKNSIKSLSVLSFLFAEGTRELMNNNCANHGYVQIWDNNDPLRAFATYNCPSYYRLNIRVAGGERIYMGFHVNNSNDATPTIANDVWFRLVDPNDNIVMGPININSSMGPGWINTCTQALIGPNALYVGGYNPLVYNVPAGPAGDYYIEFAVNNNPNIYQKRVFRFFDITVARWNGSAWVEKKGRLWSKKWDLTTRGSTNPFVGTLYTYSSDSVVTSFDFNGMRPYGFEVSCNSFGASNVGTPTNRRRSDYRQNIINNGGIPAAPEYPVFLNDPDIEFYPTGIVASIDSFSVIPCTQYGYCIYVSLSKAGQVSVTLNFNNPIYTPRNFIANLNAGSNCISWDGKDGNGNLVANGTVVNAILDFQTGLTHLPLVDVEHHNNGFKVILVRPTHKPNSTPLPAPKIYWDDVLLTDPWNSLDGVSNLTGCTPTPTLGCHRWQNRGINNANPEVINTWWYTNSEQHTFVLNIDSTKWKINSQISSCGGSYVEVKFYFLNEIPTNSINWSINTTPSGLLGQASDTTITTNGDTIFFTLHFPITINSSSVTIAFSVWSNNAQYTYCQDKDTVYCVVLSYQDVKINLEQTVCSNSFIVRIKNMGSEPDLIILETSKDSINYIDNFFDFESVYIEPKSEKTVNFRADFKETNYLYLRFVSDFYGKIYAQYLITKPSQFYSISIYKSDGSVLISSRIVADEDEERSIISSLPSGLYFILEEKNGCSNLRRVLIAK